jgi:hypothetical protein
MRSGTRRCRGGALARFALRPAPAPRGLSALARQVVNLGRENIQAHLTTASVPVTDRDLGRVLHVSNLFAGQVGDENSLSGHFLATFLSCDIGSVRLVKVSQIVSLPWLVNGFVQAYARFEEVAKQQDPEDAFHALFEVLSWAACVDERLNFPNDSPELRGLRFARNRVHHQWANALWLDQSGLSFPITFPMVFFEWRWRLAVELPEGRASPDEQPYAQHLQGQPARVTLHFVGGYLRNVQSKLA